MTTVTRSRHWAQAFMPNGNSQHARRVRDFLRQELGIQCNYDDEEAFISSVETNRGYYNYYDDVESEDLQDDWGSVDMVVRTLMNIAFNHATIRALDQKFMSKSSSIGEYTKIPFPKEKKHDNNINANGSQPASASA